MNLLLSYAYGRNPSWEPILEGVRENGGKTIADSGAFTATSAGRVVTLEGYCHFLRSRSHLFDEYIALDVLGDKEKTLENYSKMVKLGLRPLGVVTIDMKAEESLAYLEKNRRLCVAGGVLRGNESWLPHKISLINRLSEGAARIHGLGYSPTPIEPTLQLHSVDSSSWLAPLRFGRLSLWDQKRLKMESWRWADVERGETPQEVAEIFYNSNIDSARILSSPEKLTRGGFSVLGYLGALSWVCRMAFLARSQGCAFYFAAASPENILLAISAMRYGRRDGSMDIGAAIQSEDRIKKALQGDTNYVRRYIQKAFDNYRENIL